MTLFAERFELTVQGKNLSGSISRLEGLTVSKGLLWSTLHFPLSDGKHIDLNGIPNAGAQKLKRSIAAVLLEQRRRQEIATRIRDLEQQLLIIFDWARSAVDTCKQQLKRRGWLSYEFVKLTADSKPVMPPEWLQVSEVRQHLERQPRPVQEAVRLWQRPFDDFARALNLQHAAKAAEEDRSFFDSVEKSPLTTEQREAVICFDSRVLLVASAGSGKTSTMVAKAGYALRHGYFAPDRMLLLAFNNDAAAELRERIRARLNPLGKV
ncbi:hypothetical protein ABIC42_005808 [Variovorax sp. 1133]